MLISRGMQNLVNIYQYMLTACPVKYHAKAEFRRLPSDQFYIDNYRQECFFDLYFKLPLKDIYIGSSEIPDPSCMDYCMVFTGMNS